MVERIQRSIGQTVSMAKDYFALYPDYTPQMKGSTRLFEYVNPITKPAPTIFIDYASIQLQRLHTPQNRNIAIKQLKTLYSFIDEIIGAETGSTQNLIFYKKPIIGAEINPNDCGNYSIPARKILILIEAYHQIQNTYLSIGGIESVDEQTLEKTVQRLSKFFCEKNFNMRRKINNQSVKLRLG